MPAPALRRIKPGAARLRYNEAFLNLPEGISGIMQSVDFDLIICGGGPVGQSVAGLLARRQLSAARIALVHEDARACRRRSAHHRPLYGSRQILDELGAWDAIGRSATAIEQIHVSRRGHFGRTLLDRKDYDLPALGYVARYGEVNRALATPSHRWAWR
jgi:2-octaprenyl-6-methoxyphenol hydroxylase